MSRARVPDGVPYTARWSSGLRLWPLTPATGVRIPLGSPFLDCDRISSCIQYIVRHNTHNIVGVDGGEGPPVPIPNTEVKLTCADNTWRATAREDRKTPTQYAFLAQSVEHAAVNRGVVGSSPTGGASG